MVQSPGGALGQSATARWTPRGGGPSLAPGPAPWKPINLWGKMGIVSSKYFVLQGIYIYIHIEREIITYIYIYVYIYIYIYRYPHIYSYIYIYF